MNKLTTMLLAAAAVSAWAGIASAMPLNHGVTVDSSNLLQEARLVCNRAGHCFQTPVYRDYVASTQRIPAMAYLHTRIMTRPVISMTRGRESGLVSTGVNQGQSHR
jgi:hypothetical protein